MQRASAIDPDRYDRGRPPWVSSLWPAAMYLGTRLAHFLVAYLSFVWMPSPRRHFVGTTDLFISGWMNWDSGWFSSLTIKGYTNQPNSLGQADTAFFPLYPLVVRNVARLTGSVYPAALLVSHVCALIGTVLLYRVVAERDGDENARRTILLFLCFPYSIFLGAMYTEGLYLLGTVGAFYFARKGRWWLCGIFVAAASATRIVGILSLAACGLVYLERIRFRPTRIRTDVLWLSLGVLGIGLHMLNLKMRFGDPVLFLRIKDLPGWGLDNTWGRAISMLERPFFSSTSLVEGDWPGPWWFNAVALVAAIAVFLISLGRLELSLTLWTGVTLYIYSRNFGSAGRYVAMMFPLFMGASLWLRRHPMFTQALVLAWCVVSGLLIFGFAHGVWVS